jgi:hypothetical protein
MQTFQKTADRRPTLKCNGTVDLARDKYVTSDDKYTG